MNKEYSRTLNYRIYYLFAIFPLLVFTTIHMMKVWDNGNFLLVALTAPVSIATILGIILVITKKHGHIWRVTFLDNTIVYNFTGRDKEISYDEITSYHRFGTSLEIKGKDFDCLLSKSLHMLTIDDLDEIQDTLMKYQIKSKRIDAMFLGKRVLWILAIILGLMLFGDSIIIEEFTLVLITLLPAILLFILYRKEGIT